MQHIYKSGYGFKKAGVALTDLKIANMTTMDMFASSEFEDKREKLITALESVCDKYGKNALKLGEVSHRENKWEMNCKNRSPNYLSCLDDVPVVY